MSRRTQKNVGIIGLGIIGRRVADVVRRRGFPVFVWNRTPRPCPNFVGSPAEIAELCDFLQIFVSDDDALLEMIQLMKQSLKPHHVVMAHSTVAPHTMRAAAEMVHRRGAQLLDAPFTGSKGAAEKGELVYYIGGDDAAYRRARPVLEASSKEIIEIGEIGQATAIKIATNMITAATVQSAAEALALVHSSGLALDKFVTAMQSNGSNSATLAMKLPKMLAGDFEPHFSVKHMLKDVQIASRLARSYGLSLSLTEAARDSLVEETRQGRGDYDYSSVFQNFFPDGPPGVQSEEAAEQATLSGMDREEPAEVTVEPTSTAEMAEVQAVGVEPEPTSETAAAAPTVESAVPEEVNGETVTVQPNETPAETVEPVIAAVTTEEPAPNAEPATVSESADESKQPVPPNGEGEGDERRGFLSRLFGKGVDY